MPKEYRDELVREVNMDGMMRDFVPARPRCFVCGRDMQWDRMCVMFAEGIMCQRCYFEESEVEC